METGKSVFGQWLQTYGKMLLVPSGARRPVAPMAWNRTLRPWQAWAIVLSVFGLIFGRHAVKAIAIAFFGVPLEARTADVSDIVTDIVYLVIALVGLVVLLRSTRLSMGQVGLGGNWSKSRFKLEFRVGCLSAAAAMTGLLVMGVISEMAGKTPTTYPMGALATPTDWISTLSEPLVAGPVEEIPLVLILAWAFRSAGMSWKTIAITAAVLRISFHFYYGPEAIGMAVWPLLVVALYRYSGAIWGIIVAHSWIDLTAVPALYFLKTEHDVPSALAFLALKLTPAIIGAGIACATLFKTPSTPTRPPLHVG